MHYELEKRIRRIIKMNWIDVTGSKTYNPGLLLEHFLNISPGKSELPDWEEKVEIKTKTSIRKKYIVLFNATPNSKPNMIKTIHEKYGYPDKFNREFKVFQSSFYTNYKRMGNGMFYILKVDRFNKIIVLEIQKNFQVIDRSIFWTFDLLKEKLERKLKYLLLTQAKKVFEHQSVLIRYLSAVLYIYKGFDHFLSAFEKGYIRVTFKVGVFKKDYRYGEIHDRGTSFELEEKYLEEVFQALSVWD